MGRTIPLAKAGGNFEPRHAHNSGRGFLCRFVQGQHDRENTIVFVVHNRLAHEFEQTLRVELEYLQIHVDGVHNAVT